MLCNQRFNDYGSAIYATICCKILSFLTKITNSTIGQHSESDALSWKDLGITNGLDKVIKSEIIFTPMDNAKTESYRNRYSGNQKERIEKDSKNSNSVTKEPKKEPKEAEPLSPKEQINLFNEKIMLKVAKIIEISRHPDAEKLYVEKLDDGTGVERIICSGLVPYLKEEELLDKHVVIVDNLKSRKLRGIESRGMLLAADYKDSEGNEKVEVLECHGQNQHAVVLKMLHRILQNQNTLMQKHFCSSNCC